MVNKKKVNQFTFFSKLYFIFVLFAKMHGRKLYTIKTISQRHFDTSSHICRLSRMNISKYQRYSSSRSPERRNYSQYHPPGSKDSRYSRHLSQR
jgi:hypothetical protein